MIEIINDYNGQARYKNEKLQFFPPVTTQRYCMIFHILRHDIWAGKLKKVIDFGCSELNFARLLKRVDGVEQIVAVDIDEEILKNNIDKLRPQLQDHFDRKQPLKYEVFCGSIDKSNECLLNADAVIGIEVIEHLTADVFINFAHNIFEYIKPKLIVFTTPNYDFNVIFNRPGFRHYDHKFEWTREQFHDWANNLCIRYPSYNVQFKGIGCGPVNTEHLGCCSQLALFIRSDILIENQIRYENNAINLKDNDTANDVNDKNDVVNGHHQLNQVFDMDEYKLFFTVDYPYYIETRTKEEIILQKVISIIDYLIDEPPYELDYEKRLFLIPLDEIRKRSDLFNDLDLFRSVINSHTHFNVNDDDVIEISENIYDLTDSEEELDLHASDNENNCHAYYHDVPTIKGKLDEEECW